MKTISLEMARQDLATIVQRALAGEDIVIGAPGAEVKLTPVAPAASQTVGVPTRKSYRGRGVLKGQLVVGPEFFEPLSDEECGVEGDAGAS